MGEEEESCRFISIYKATSERKKRRGEEEGEGRGRRLEEEEGQGESADLYPFTRCPVKWF